MAENYISPAPSSTPPYTSITTPVLSVIPEKTSLGGAPLTPFVLLGDTPAKPSDAKPEQLPDPVFTAIGDLIRKNFSSAFLFRSASGITDELNRSQRQRQGIYEDDALASINSTGGCSEYFNITNVKCEGGEAWVRDVMTPVGDSPYGLDATPIPDLPDSEIKAIKAKVLDHFREVAQSGIALTPGDVMAVTDLVYKSYLMDLRKEAQTKADAHSAKIEDQKTEGNFDLAFDGFLHNLFTFPSAIIKREIRSICRSKWQGDKLVEQYEDVPWFSSISPHDFYPSPNSHSVNEGFICETKIIDKRDLTYMKGRKGWNSEAIDNILDMGDDTSRVSTWSMILPGASERASLENRLITYYGGIPPGSLFAIENWFCCPRQLLLDSGLADSDLPLKKDYIEICAIQAANQTLYIGLNPDPHGRRPYYATSVKKVPGSLWGISLPAMMRDCQYGVNGSKRALFNNLAFASGPMYSGNIDAMPAGEDWTKIRPWRFFQYSLQKAIASGGSASGNDVIKFFQPNPMIDELLRVSDHFESQADDRTGIPHYVSGDSNMGGAARTASGLSMLIQSGNKGVKRILIAISHDVYEPAMQDLYDFNMTYLPDKDWKQIKGDARIVPRGMMAMFLRDQVQQRRMEAWDRLKADPMAQQIVGLEGYATLLRGIFDDPHLGLDAKLIPDEDELKQRLAKVQADSEQQASMQQDAQQAEIDKTKADAMGAAGGGNGSSPQPQEQFRIAAMNAPPQPIRGAPARTAA